MQTSPSQILTGILPSFCFTVEDLSNTVMRSQSMILTNSDLTQLPTHPSILGSQQALSRAAYKLYFQMAESDTWIKDSHSSFGARASWPSAVKLSFWKFKCGTENCHELGSTKVDSANQSDWTSGLSLMGSISALRMELHSLAALISVLSLETISKDGLPL